MKPIAACLTLCLITIPLTAQEDARRVVGSGGKFTKHLTMNQVDTWEIECKAGEMLTAWVESRHFDPVLKLQAPGGAILQEVDDEGSESRFAQRLGGAGKYKILVHAFRNAGGGNYALHVDRFTAVAVAAEVEHGGRVGRDGRAHLRFTAGKGQVLVPRFVGEALAHTFLDPQGREVSGWEGSLTVETEGEHVLRLKGTPEQVYAVTLLAAVPSDLVLDQQGEATLAPGAMHLWTFQSVPGDLRLIELVCDQRPAARLIYLPPDDEEKGTLLERERPALREIPVASKGRTVRFAAVLGRKGRFQLQLRSGAWSEMPYAVTLTDPAEDLPIGALDATLPVGGARFYRFSAEPGELLDLQLRSQSFDALLRLFGAEGEAIDSNDDGGGDLDSSIRHLVRRGGVHYAQVSSHGDGGGGAFELERTLVEIVSLKIGDRRTGELGSGGREIWHFEGRAGATILISVRAATFDPTVEVRAPDGVTLGSDDDSGVGRDSLLPLELPRDGRYTLIVRSARGAGRYTLRLIDGE